MSAARQPDIEYDRNDTVRHGHSSVLAPLERKRVLTWWDPGDCVRPVTLAVFQSLEGQAPPGLAPALAALSPKESIPADIRLAINWGSGGVQAGAFLDLDRSTCLTVVASKVELHAIYLGWGDLDPAAPGAPPFPSVRVSAMAGEATAAIFPPPRLTERITPGVLIDPGPPGIDIVVPAFAFEVRPSVPYLAGPGQVDLTQLNATGAALWRSEFGDDDPERRMVLDGFCRLVNFQHSFLVPLPRAALVFGLAL